VLVFVYVRGRGERRVVGCGWIVFFGGGFLGGFLGFLDFGNRGQGVSLGGLLFPIAIKQKSISFRLC
jgi:hypothetical protein